MVERVAGVGIKIIRKLPDVAKIRAEGVLRRFLNFRKVSVKVFYSDGIKHSATPLSIVYKAIGNSLAKSLHTDSKIKIAASAERSTRRRRETKLLFLKKTTAAFE